MSTATGDDAADQMVADQMELVIGAGEYLLNGQRVPVPGGSVHQAAIADIADRVTGPVQVITREDGDTYLLHVTPSGAVTKSPATGAVVVGGGGSTTSISPIFGEPQQMPVEVATAQTQHTQQKEQTKQTEQVQTRAQRREAMTFLPSADEAFSSVAAPAQVGGWHGFLRSIGLEKAPAGPSPEQLTERAQLRAISQHWAGPRTIAVVNPKGGAGKTPTAVLLAAMFARWGGAGCLAWDNNETRGTMGWRTEQGPHEAHVRDLLAAAPDLMSADARTADLAAFVHHQTEDKYDVLRSNPPLHRPRRTPHVCGSGCVAPGRVPQLPVDLHRFGQR